MVPKPSSSSSDRGSAFSELVRVVVNGVVVVSTQEVEVVSWLVTGVVHVPVMEVVAWLLEVVSWLLEEFLFVVRIVSFGA